MAERYSKRWHEERIEQHLGELAAEAANWYERDREDPHAAKAIAARITNIARALSADTAAIGALDYQEWVRRPMV